MKFEIGKQSVQFLSPVYIQSSASIVGKKEGEGPLGLLFDYVSEDEFFGGKTWEEAESILQKDAFYIALSKAKCKLEDIRYCFAGDLLGQSIATTYGLKNFQIPIFGLYGACSTCALGLALGAICISGGFAKYVACVTSSHYASVEKEFRFPLEYGNQRPLSSSFTVTGSGAFILSSILEEGTRAKISAATIGRIVDLGLKDSMNMGACMAPAAADVIYNHFQDFKMQADEYDKVITGDLGKIGKEAVINLLKEKGYDISEQYMDCGIEIYDSESQDTYAGGSGCGCCAVTLSAYILKQLEEGNWEKVLFVATGALMNKTSFNEGKTVPAIAHAVVIERTV